MLTPEQIAARRTGVGGSDVAAILGLNPWATALDIWYDKLGLHPHPIDNDNPPEAIRWGNLLEPVIANEVSERYAIWCERVDTVIHPDHEWMRVNPDRIMHAVDVGGKKGVLEIKTTSAYLAKEWKGDEAPAPAIAQVCWAMAITGLHWGSVAGLVGGQRLVVRDVEYDQDLIDRIVQRCGEFWHEHVLTRVPPPAVAADRKLVKALYATGGQGAIEADGELQQLQAEYVALRLEVKALRDRKDAVEARIRQVMGDHDMVTVDEQPIMRLTRVGPVEVPAHTRPASRRLYVTAS